MAVFNPNMFQAPAPVNQPYTPTQAYGPMTIPGRTDWQALGSMFGGVNPEYARAYQEWQARQQPGQQLPIPAPANASYAPINFDPAQAAGNNIARGVQWPQASPAGQPQTTQASPSVAPQQPTAPPAPAYQEPGMNPLDSANVMHRAEMAMLGLNLDQAGAGLRKDFATNAFSSPEYMGRVQMYLHSGLDQATAEAAARRDITNATPGLAVPYHDTYEQADLQQQQQALDRLGGVAANTGNTNPYNSASGMGLSSVSTAAPQSVVRNADGTFTLFDHTGTPTTTSAQNFPAAFAPIGPQEAMQLSAQQAPELLKMQAQVEAAAMRNPEIARLMFNMDNAKDAASRQKAQVDLMLKMIDPKTGLQLDPQTVQNIQKALTFSAFHATGQ